MRRLIPCLAASLTILFTFNIAAAKTTIAREGKSEAVIVVDPAASAPQKYAASELAEFLRQVTGTSFEIRPTPQADRCNLLVGPAAAKSADPSFSTEGLGNDGIIIRTVGNDIILAGGEPRGTLYAVYGFLEDQVGCHWWTPAVSTIPNKPTLDVGELNVRFVPPLEYRETDCPGAVEGVWSARNHFNGSYHELDGVRGGKIGYIAQNKWSNGGTFWTLIPPELYFQPHPEWFSLIDGKRRCAPNEHASLCLTNPQMRLQLLENQRLALLWHPGASLVSISQIDDAGPPEHCQCDKCMAIEKEEGSAAGVMIRFVNACAEDLEKDYPNLLITTLAYHYTQKPPLHVKPRQNVAVQLCDIHCSFAVPLSDERNKEFRDDLLGWAKICNRLYFWDYTGNFSYTLLPHPNLRVQGPNVRYLIQCGVKGMFAEAPTARGEVMSALRSWLLGQLYWNPAQDERKLIAEFCDGYFGAGGKHIVAYLDLIHDAVEASGDPLGLSSPPDAKFLSFAILSKGWSHLQAAEEAVAKEPALRQRVRAEQIAVLYATVMNWKRCHEQAAEAKAEWPFPPTVAAAIDQVKIRAGEQGIDLTSVPLPAISDPVPANPK